MIKKSRANDSVAWLKQLQSGISYRGAFFRPVEKALSAHGIVSNGLVDTLKATPDIALSWFWQM